jgi:hypothetical protein
LAKIRRRATLTSISRTMGKGWSLVQFLHTSRRLFPGSNFHLPCSRALGSLDNFLEYHESQAPQIYFERVASGGCKRLRRRAILTFIVMRSGEYYGIATSLVARLRESPGGRPGRCDRANPGAEARFHPMNRIVSLPVHGTPGLGLCIFMHIWKADRAGTSPRASTSGGGRSGCCLRVCATPARGQVPRVAAPATWPSHTAARLRKTEPSTFLRASETWPA